MKKYSLFISMPTAKYHTSVKAELVKFNQGRISFYLDKKLIATYPGEYTVIEKITKVKDD